MEGYMAMATAFITKVPEILYSYTNGNTKVTLYSDGTKEREYEGSPAPVHPDHLDVKITNWCDNPICAKFCHEKSNMQGKAGDLSSLIKFLSPLPAGVELALGGGHTLSHPNLLAFLVEAFRRNWVCNVTVNSYHLTKERDLLSGLITSGLVKGVGISYYPKFHKEVVDFCNTFENAVVHTIAAITSPDSIKKLLEEINLPKILILGYKHYGNGADFAAANEKINGKIKNWPIHLNNLVYETQKMKKKTLLSFDNLAITQLKVRRFFRDKEWEQFYCGDDGQFSMYYDAVKQEAKVSSTSSEVVNGDNVVEAFQSIRRKRLTF